jgi:ParB family chromosome partitioning protein
MKKTEILSIPIDELHEHPERKNMTNDNKLVYIPVDDLYPHLLNPRKDLGDLTEITDSIRANGILQNLTVQKGRYDSDGTFHDGDDGYTILIGHRRHAAAKLAGLETVPCVIVNISEAEQVQMMCMENMQRTDLTIYEQAVSFQMMLDFGGSVEEVAAKTGFSKTTIKRRLQMAKLDRETMLAVSGRQASLQDYDRLAQIEDIDTRNKVLCEIGTNNFNSAIEKAVKAQQDKKNSDDWREFFDKNGVKEIPEDDIWSSKYQNLGYVTNAFSKEKFNALIKDKEYSEIFFAASRYPGTTFYIRAPKVTTEAEVAAAEERARELELERQRRGRLNEIANRAYKLRFDFIKNFPLSESKKVAGTVAKWHFLREIVGMLTVGVLNGYGPMQAGKENFSNLFDVNAGTDTQILVDFVDKHAEKALLMQVYAQWCDNASGCWDYSMHYRESPRLKWLYKFLCDLGYRMSDEETQMINGTLPDIVKDDTSVIDTSGDEADVEESMDDADLDELLKAQLEELHDE